MSTKTDTLSHREACTASRVESTDYPEAGITTTRCCDCGAHEAKDTEGKTLAPPDVIGGARGQGRGDMDVTMERAR